MIAGVVEGCAIAADAAKRWYTITERASMMLANSDLGEMVFLWIFVIVSLIVFGIIIYVAVRHGFLEEKFDQDTRERTREEVACYVSEGGLSPEIAKLLLESHIPEKSKRKMAAIAADTRLTIDDVRALLPKSTKKHGESKD